MILVYFLIVLLFSFVTTFVLTKIITPRLKKFRIVGRDLNKPGQPEVAEMGGIAIVAGFTAGILLIVFANTFFGTDEAGHLSFLYYGINLIYVLAALITIHTIAFIGIVDDLLDVPQWLKAILPLFAGIPLIAVKAAGSTMMTLPFIGAVDFGIFYILVLIPLGVAVSSNLTNMLAGFNGLESGLGIIIFASASLFAALTGKWIALVIFVPMLGALLGFIPHNWYPAKIFMGDVGALSIGAALAAGVIIGNMESVGALLLSLHVIDFFIKFANGFPKTFGNYRMGKLYAPEGRVRGLSQLIMKLARGTSETNLVIALLVLQTIVAILTLAFYLK